MSQVSELEVAMDEQPPRPDVLIIGTSHKLQVGVAPWTAAQQETYQHLIHAVCDEYGVKLIAEEMSADALPPWKVAETLGCKVAKELRIESEYVCLTLEERRWTNTDNDSMISMNLVSQHAQQFVIERLAWQVKENIWLFKLLKLGKWPALFVCGANHVDRMQLLFSSVGKLTKLIHRDYEAPPTQQYQQPN